MFIYGLYSTKDNAIRYVGKTKNALQLRLNQHVRDAINKKANTYKDRWIRKCYRDGYEINIKAIEIVNEYNINDREKFWIEKLPNLTNTAPGGEGGGLVQYDKNYDYCKKWILENMPSVTSSVLYNRFAKTDKIPSFMPKDPLKHFKATNEWISWGDFLSTNNIQDNKKALNYLSYKDAKKYLRHIRLTSATQYKKYLIENKIEFLSMRPDRYYLNKGWENWGLFLGTKKPYQITEELIINYLNTYFKEVNTQYKYKKYSYKFNNAIPKNIVTLNKMFPNFNWSKVNNHMIENYKEAEKLVRSLNVSTYEEYRNIVIEKYSGILPLSPSLTYKNKGWRNMMTYLGSSKIKHKCDITLELFRRYMKRYHPNVNSSKKYKEFYKQNKKIISNRIPSRPDITFKLTYCQIFSVKPKRTVPICDYSHFIKVMIEKHEEIKHAWQYNKLLKENKLEEEFPRCPCFVYNKKWNELIEDIKINKEV